MGFKTGGGGRILVESADVCSIYIAANAAAPDDTLYAQSALGMSANAVNQFSTGTAGGTTEVNVYHPNDGKYTIADIICLKVNNSSANVMTTKIYVDGVLKQTHVGASATGDRWLILKLGGMAYKNLRITITAAGAGVSTGTAYGNIARVGLK